MFIRGRKLNVSLVFITQLYFKVPKYVRLNSTHFFIMNIPNKSELQQIAQNYSSGINSKDFMIYKTYTAEPYSFLVNDATLTSDNPLRFRKYFHITFSIYKKSWQLIFRLEMKNYNTILTEKQSKYQPYHQTKSVSINILLVKKYYHLIKTDNRTS